MGSYILGKQYKLDQTFWGNNTRILPNKGSFMFLVKKLQNICPKGYIWNTNALCCTSKPSDLLLKVKYVSNLLDKYSVVLLQETWGNPYMVELCYCFPKKCLIILFLYLKRSFSYDTYIYIYIHTYIQTGIERNMEREREI